MTLDSNRKDQHVDLAEKQYQPADLSDFGKMRFVHHSLPNLKVADISLHTEFAGMSLAAPFYINGMTGGSERTKQINADLATVAKMTGLAMASGSVSAALKDPSVSDSFAIIRKVNPNGKVFANIGAHHSLENAKRAVDILEADALQIHINAPQEMIMPEGDRDFTMWLRQIEEITAHVGVPVIVKEVGFGMSRETIAQLIAVGVRTIDVSGKGGTNFAAIENARRTAIAYDELENWGQSTLISLLEADVHRGKAEFLASGGIKTPLDIVKALSLGAKAVGLSGQFLHMVLSNGPEKTAETVEAWKEQITTVMAMLGKTSVADLARTDLIFQRDIIDWCEMRGIDYRQYANRSVKS